MGSIFSNGEEKKGEEEGTSCYSSRSEETDEDEYTSDIDYQLMNVIAVYSLFESLIITDIMKHEIVSYVCPSRIYSSKDSGKIVDCNGFMIAYDVSAKISQSRLEDMFVENISYSSESCETEENGRKRRNTTIKEKLEEIKCFNPIRGGIKYEPITNIDISEFRFADNESNEVTVSREIQCDSEFTRTVSVKHPKNARILKCIINEGKHYLIVKVRKHYFLLECNNREIKQVNITCDRFDDVLITKNNEIFIVVITKVEYKYRYTFSIVGTDGHTTPVHSTILRYYPSKFSIDSNGYLVMMNRNTVRSKLLIIKNWMDNGKVICEYEITRHHFLGIHEDDNGDDKIVLYNSYSDTVLII